MNGKNQVIREFMILILTGNMLALLMPACFSYSKNERSPIFFMG